jgi:hypothetical protein
MPHEGDLVARSRAALALWQSLRVGYDAIEAALAAPERHELALLGERIVALEAELKPLVGELMAARSRSTTSDPVLLEIWRATDATVESLAARQPTLVRAALDARSATAARLEVARAARGQLRSYEGGDGRGAQLTSRHA